MFTKQDATIARGQRPPENEFWELGVPGVMLNAGLPDHCGQRLLTNDPLS